MENIKEPFQDSRDALANALQKVKVSIGGNMENIKEREATTAPWKVDESGFRVIDERGTLIADCSPKAGGPMHLGTCRANANLSAAAPDLLAALEAIRARINGEFDHPALVAFGMLADTQTDVLEIAYRAIAKARVNA